MPVSYGFTSLASEVAFKGEVPLEKIGGKSIPLYRCPAGKTLVIDHVAFHLSRKGTVRVTLQAGGMDLDWFYVSGPPAPRTESSRPGGAWTVYSGSELSMRFERTKLKAKATFSMLGKVGVIGVVGSGVDEQLPTPRTAVEQLPTLDDEDIRILRALAENPSVLLTQVEIETASSVSRKTISARMKTLLQNKLVERPRGLKSGTKITNLGLRALDTIGGAMVTQ